MISRAGDLAFTETGFDFVDAGQATDCCADTVVLLEELDNDPCCEEAGSTVTRTSGFASGFADMVNSLNLG